MCIWWPIPLFSLSWDGEAESIGLLQESSRDVLADESHGREMVPHLIDGQDSIADQLSLGVDKGWKDQPGTVTQQQIGRHVQCLQGGKRCGCNEIPTSSSKLEVLAWEIFYQH